MKIRMILVWKSWYALKFITFLNEDQLFLLDILKIIYQCLKYDRFFAIKSD